MPPADRWPGQRRPDRCARPGRVRATLERIRRDDEHVRRRRRLRRGAPHRHRRCGRLHFYFIGLNRPSRPDRRRHDERARRATRDGGARGRGRRQHHPALELRRLSPVVDVAAVPGELRVLIGDLVAGENVELVLEVRFPTADVGVATTAFLTIADCGGVLKADACTVVCQHAEGTDVDAQWHCGGHSDSRTPGALIQSCLSVPSTKRRRRHRTICGIGTGASRDGLRA
jgi:hypothetical protein